METTTFSQDLEKRESDRIIKIKLEDGEDLSREIPVGAAAEPEPLDPLLRPDALAAGEDSGENARL